MINVECPGVADVGDGLHKCRLAAYVLNKHSRQSTRGGSLAWGWANNSQPVTIKNCVLRNITKESNEEN
jgi:hypothetical protein